MRFLLHRINFLNCINHGIEKLIVGQIWRNCYMTCWIEVYCWHVCDAAAKTPSDLVKEMEEKKMVLNRKVCLHSHRSFTVQWNINEFIVSKCTVFIWHTISVLVMLILLIIIGLTAGNALRLSARRLSFAWLTFCSSCSVIVNVNQQGERIVIVVVILCE